MTVSVQTPFNSYSANGVTVAFSFTFKILQSSDLVVQVTDADGVTVTKTVGVHYTVSGVGAGSGGSVTFLAAPASGTTVKLSRVSQLSRTTDYQVAGELAASVLNADMDRVWLTLQEMMAGVQIPANAVRAPAGESLPQLAAAASRADRLLAFDSTTGQPEMSPFTATQIASAIASAYAGTAGPLDALTFIASGTGARSRSAQAKAREWGSAMDFGAIGDGTAHPLSERYATLAEAQVDYPFVTSLTQTIDWAAIVAGKKSGCGALFLPPPFNFVVRDPLTVTTGDAILFGLNGRFINAAVSQITVDHTGTGIQFENQTGLGSGLWNIVVRRSAGFFTQGTNIALDSLGAGPSTIVSHTDLDGVTSYGGQVGLVMRGLIFSHCGRINILNASVGLAFPGAGSTGYNPSNVVTFDSLSIQACTTAIAFEADAGTNIYFRNLDIESCTDTISIAAGCSVSQIKVDMLWLEDNTNGMKLRAGSHIHFGFIRHNNAAGITLFDAATFGAKFVTVDTVVGSAGDFSIGAAGVNVANVEPIANGGWAMTASNVTRSYANGVEMAGAVSAQQLSATSALDVLRQSGRASKNYLVDADILASGNWGRGSATNLSAQTDPLGGGTAYSWSGPVFGGCGAMPVVANGQQKEMVIWAKGTGLVKLQNWGRSVFWNINSATWIRLPFRVVIEDAATQAMDGYNLSLTPTSVGSLHVWRPGVYEGFDSIDTRPGSAAGIYQGGDLDFTAYPVAERRANQVVVYAAAIPATGFFTAGDMAINTAAPVLDASNMVLAGWKRLTTGNAHVLGTDWARIYESHVSPAT